MYSNTFYIKPSDQKNKKRTIHFITTVIKKGETSISSRKPVRKFERKQKLDTIMIKLYAFQRKKGLKLMTNHYGEKEK